MIYMNLSWIDRSMRGDSLASLTILLRCLSGESSNSLLHSSNVFCTSVQSTLEHFNKTSRLAQIESHCLQKSSTCLGWKVKGTSLLASSCSGKECHSKLEIFLL